MENIKKKRNPFSLLILSLLLCLTMFMPVSIVGASAEGTGEEVSHSLETVIENTTFVTFRKCDITSKYKRAIFSCFYVPNTVYETEYTYGCVIFPKDYADRYDLKSDYIKKAEEQNVLLMTMEATEALQGVDGRIFKFGIVEMMDQNVNRTFAFIFYVKDAEGNIEYTNAEFAAYSTLEVKDYTDAELIKIVERKMETVNSFKAIVDKITELVNSFWKYIVLGMAGIIVVWGGYIGMRVIIAKKNEEKINARGMVKSLVIGIIVMFVIAMAGPLLIKGLSSWLAW